MAILSEIGNSIRSASESIDSTSLLKKIDELKKKIEANHGSIRQASETMAMQIELNNLQKELSTQGCLK